MGQCLSQQSDSTFTELWQDRQIRWDQAKQFLILREGEELVKDYDSVEDTKGDNGIGRLQLSTLRVIWWCAHTGKLNLSIGLGCVTYIHFNMASSSTFGRVRATNLMTNFNNTRFEFVFAVRSDVSLQLFNDLESVIRRFRATKIYRDLLLRSNNLMSNGDIIQLAHEQILKRVEDADNLTTSESFPGKLIVTNYRIVWVSERGSDINVSVPYVQLKQVGSRLSSFGTALVIETFQVSGGYILGFRFPNQDNILHEVLDCMTKQLKASRQHPYLGPTEGSVQFVDDRFVVVLPENVTPNEGSTDVPNTNARESPLSVSAEETPSGAGLNSPAPEVETGDADGNGPDASSEYIRSITDPLSHSPPAQPNSGSIPGAGQSRSDAINLPQEALPSRFSAAVARASTTPMETRSAGGMPELARTPSSIRRNGGTNRLINWTPRSRGDNRGCSFYNHDPVPLNLTDKTQLADPSISAHPADAVMSPASHKYLRGSPKCVVCMAAPDEAAFDPCGHICTCMDCALKIDKCPMCRECIVKVLKIYITQ